MNTKDLATLWNVTQVHPGTSGARATAGVLLGLYNGTRFPCDLVDLRVLDSEYLQAALSVIAGDAGNCQMEVHEWLNRMTGRRDFGQRFEHLAYQLKRKGRTKRENLAPLTPAWLVIRLEEPGQ